MEQIEDFGDLRKLLWQIHRARFPQRLLTVHEQDDLFAGIGIALPHLLGQPTEDPLRLRLGGVVVVALQGGADVLGARPRA